MLGGHVFTRACWTKSRSGITATRNAGYAELGCVRLLLGGCAVATLAVGWSGRWPTVRKGAQRIEGI
jgi:hypothetical protein